MGYDFDSDSDRDSSPLSRMSGKKMAALAILVIIGAVFGVQFLFGFPLKDLFRKEVSDTARVVIKDDQGTCIVESSDREPRSISNCHYKVGDLLTITYKEGTVPIEKYRLKS
ncbi:MAG TPA: hypothetical protein VH500_01965 [Nitrososphaeraceae archaeon]